MAGAADRRCTQTLSEVIKQVGDASPPPNHVVDLDADRHGRPLGRPVHFVLSFSNLSYSVPNPERYSRPLRLSRFRHRLFSDPVIAKTLLSSISGEAREGEILAVLGASGSGKSTLIDALADRISKDSLKGSVTLNGEPLESRLLRSISAYVMQDDLLFPMLTVEETLTFSAEFRLPRSLSAARKRLRVQSLIDQLGLRAAASTIIGDEGHRGISGGERRRVSIGVDIIHDPIILFLDEPTSGLDSSSAFLVVNVLRRIAKSGSVVIMTVHQPSYRILGLLDRLIFLSRGETVFSGNADELGAYFAEFGRPIPEDENKAEFALDLIRELENNSSPIEKRSLVDFHRTWQLSRIPTTITFSSFSLKDAISASISRGKLVSSIPLFANPFYIEVGVLIKRSFTNTRRMPELLAMRLGTVLVTGFILATVFWRLDESPRGAQERLGFFAFAMSTMFYTCADALPVFLQERYIFARETAYNAYRHSSYVLSNAAVGFPPLVLLSFAFALTTFFAVGLAGGASGFSFYFLIILASFWSGSGFVTFISGVVSHVMVGYTVVVAILAYFLLFSGFFINRDRIPGYWIWFHYLSLVKYPYEGVLHNEFGRVGDCFVKGTQMFDNSPLGEMPAEMKGRVMVAISEALGVTITGETCLTTGGDVLVQEGITQLGKWECLLVTVAWGFVFRLLFYFTLMLGNKNRRR
ncbi:ABC transporter G family member 16-like [Typha angustifolia]|uniref:ABC transporter G family member 16-like n=1 Tax=Typha angustifolia TaxID=59011 RepID=UPI003C2BC6C8